MDVGNDEGDQRRHIARQGLACVVLDPLAEVRIGMFVAVMIGRGQFVMDLESDRKRRQGQKDAHQGQGETPSDHQAGSSGE